MGINDLAIIQCFPFKTGRLARRNQASVPTVGGIRLWTMGKESTNIRRLKFL